MKSDKTPEYWPTRILLAVAIIATATVVVFAWSALRAGPMLGGDEDRVLGLPGAVVTSLLAVTLALLGLVWSIRIFRGPRDEPTPWRYRDG